MRTKRGIIPGLVFVTLFCSFVVSTRAQTEGEANLKAAFIYNFTKYVDWDTSTASGDFIIGIIGSSSITDPLTEIAKTNTVKNKRIIIKNFSRPEDIGFCHILFIGRNNQFSLQSILGKVGRNVLTISEEDGFAKMGTALNFIIINNKLKFEANLNAINSAGFKAGSQLLKLAIII